MIDASMGNRVEDRLAHRPIPPCTPRNQQTALCVWVEMTHLIQELGSGHPREPVSGKDQGDLVTGSRKLLQTGERLLRRAH